jgi:DNA-directed RNA polymerase beta' subunit
MLFKQAEKKTFGTKSAAASAANSATINNTLYDLIVTVTALRDVLLKENDALDHTNTRAFLEMQDEKVTVARRYESLMTALLAREDLKSADPKLKTQLLSIEEGFTTVMKENLIKIDRMKNATEKLGERIMKSARKSAESMTQFAYGASGTMQRGNKATIGVSEQA